MPSLDLPEMRLPDKQRHPTREQNEGIEGNIEHHRRSILPFGHRNHDARKSCACIGMRRMRFPVAANTAL